MNLEQHRRLEAVFAVLDVTKILLELEAIGKVAPGPDTRLFMDEVQATPSAIAALRYLFEQGPGVTGFARAKEPKSISSSPWVDGSFRSK